MVYLNNSLFNVVFLTYAYTHFQSMKTLIKLIMITIKTDIVKGFSNFSFFVIRCRFILVNSHLYTCLSNFSLNIRDSLCI